MMGQDEKGTGGTGVVGVSIAEANVTSGIAILIIDAITVVHGITVPMTVLRKRQQILLSNQGEMNLHHIIGKVE